MSLARLANQPSPLASERQRLETQYNNLQAEWQTRTERLAQLRLTLANHPAIKPLVATLKGFVDAK